jgi:cytosine/uracil/thiamine/allantoin permease
MVNRNTVLMPASDFANAFPQFISFKIGGLIRGCSASRSSRGSC